MKLLLFLMVFVNVSSIFGYGPGSGTLELRIRIRQKFLILPDPDPQHCTLVHEILRLIDSGDAAGHWFKTSDGSLVRDTVCSGSPAQRMWRLVTQ
jgi:hypothetical protein